MARLIYRLFPKLRPQHVTSDFTYRLDVALGRAEVIR